jgi:hypothetical protein
VVGRLLPFTLTDELLVKPAPRTVKVTGPLPVIAESGEMLKIDGTGSTGLKPL